MNRWASVRLADIAAQGQYGLNAAAMKEGQGIRFIRITDIDEQSELRKDGAAYVPSSTENLTAYYLEAGDLLIARSGATAGKSLLFKGLEEPAVFAGYLIRFKLDTSVALPDYVGYFFKSNIYWNYINTTKRAAAQPNINAKELASLPISLPSLSEQRRIVDLLSRAEGIVRLRREAEKKAAELIPALFLDMFGDPATNPKGWAEQRLGDIAEVVSGVTKGRKFGDKKTVEVPYLRVANVQAGHINLTEVKTIEVLPQEVIQLTLQHGDVVLTEGGDFDKLGRGALWEHDIPNCIHQNHVFRVRLNKAVARPEFFVTYLQAGKAREYFLRCAKRTTNLASINMTQLRGLPVVLPALNTQQGFVDRFSEARSIQTQQSAATAKAQATFDALLATVFSN